LSLGDFCLIVFVVTGVNDADGVSEIVRSSLRNVVGDSESSHSEVRVQDIDPVASVWYTIINEEVHDVEFSNWRVRVNQVLTGGLLPLTISVHSLERRRSSGSVMTSHSLATGVTSVIMASQVHTKFSSQSTSWVAESGLKGCNGLLNSGFSF